jgi:hypothetical protein
MAAEDIPVFVTGGVVSIDDFSRAMSAKEVELPRLSEAQREAARLIGMPEYARGTLAEDIAERRELEKGKRLSEIISRRLGRVGQGWRLRSLLLKGGRDRVWEARFEESGRQLQVVIPNEFVDDVVKSGEPFREGQLDSMLKELDGSAARKAS